MWYVNNLQIHRSKISDPYITKQEYEKILKNIEKKIIQIEESIKEKRQHIYEMTQLLNQVDKAIKDIVAQFNTVNSHKKLLHRLLKSSSLKYFRDLGYIGVAEDFTHSLLYALEITDVYSVYSDLIESEYFTKIIEQMNLVSRHT